VLKKGEVVLMSIIHVKYKKAIDLFCHDCRVLFSNPLNHAKRRKKIKKMKIKNSLLQRIKKKWFSFLVP